MKISNYFLPTLKENPIDASIASHQLMIRAGMIRQTASGIYSWLPLGLRILQKVEAIIRGEMNKSGALEVLMPTIQPAELWIESGRYDAYGREMLRIKDRHDRDLLYGPTHEEVITDIFRKNLNSYKDLPKNLYQIHWKFRDEIRPRFGLMRAREFLMKDSYSFDLDEKSAKETYDLMFATYFKIFQRLGLKAIALRADTGAIGGDLSHEFHILAETGESAIYFDAEIEEILNSENPNLEKLQNLYAMADELHQPSKCEVPPEKLKSKRGIEVGHIFNSGVKYTSAMNVFVTNEKGEKIHPNCGCYGIGVSRIVAAAIEANHDEKGIIWPRPLAPFAVSLINVKVGDELCDKFCEEIYQSLQQRGVEVIFDDSKASLGQKLAIADLIGIPTQIIVGPKSASAGMVEIKNRATNEKQEISKEALFNLQF
jgi:prolyl-tRNA synthetase